MLKTEFELLNKDIAMKNDLPKIIDLNKLIGQKIRFNDQIFVLHDIRDHFCYLDISNVGLPKEIIIGLEPIPQED